MRRKIEDYASISAERNEQVFWITRGNKGLFKFTLIQISLFVYLSNTFIYSGCVCVSVMPERKLVNLAVGELDRVNNGI